MNQTIANLLVTVLVALFFNFSAYAEADGADAGDGGSIVLHGKVWEVADLHFKFVEDEFVMTKELRARLEQYQESAKYIFDSDFTSQSKKRNLFDDEILADDIKYMFVDRLDSRCKFMPDDRLPNGILRKDVGCTLQGITFLLPEGFAKLDLNNKATFLVHERAIALTKGLISYTVIAAVSAGLHRINERYYPAILRGDKSFLFNEKELDAIKWYQKYYHEIIDTLPHHRDISTVINPDGSIQIGNGIIIKDEDSEVGPGVKILDHTVVNLQNTDVTGKSSLDGHYLIKDSFVNNSELTSFRGLVMIDDSDIRYSGVSTSRNNLKRVDWDALDFDSLVKHYSTSSFQGTYERLQALSKSSYFALLRITNSTISNMSMVRGRGDWRNGEILGIEGTTAAPSTAQFSATWQSAPLIPENGVRIVGDMNSFLINDSQGSFEIDANGITLENVTQNIGRQEPMKISGSNIELRHVRLNHMARHTSKSGPPSEWIYNDKWVANEARVEGNRINLSNISAVRLNVRGSKIIAREITRSNYVEIYGHGIEIENVSECTEIGFLQNIEQEEITSIFKNVTCEFGRKASLLRFELSPQSSFTESSIKYQGIYDRISLFPNTYVTNIGTLDLARRDYKYIRFGDEGKSVSLDGNGRYYMLQRYRTKIRSQEKLDKMY